VNPIYRVMPQSTRLPAIAFPLIGFFALFAGRRRYAYAARGISIHGFIDGAALVVGLVVTLAVLWHFWRWSGLSRPAVRSGFSTAHNQIRSSLKLSLEESGRRSAL
jgi:hypothetical protein